MRVLLLFVLLAVVGAAAVWWLAPQHVPEAWRAALQGDPRDDARSPHYAPPVYRWRDADGVLQITDQPPADRPYEEVRVNPETNVVPSTLPVGQELPEEARSGDER